MYRAKAKTERLRVIMHIYLLFHIQTIGKYSLIFSVQLEYICMWCCVAIYLAATKNTRMWVSSVCTTYIPIKHWIFTYALQILRQTSRHTDIERVREENCTLNLAYTHIPCDQADIFIEPEIYTYAINMHNTKHTIKTHNISLQS